MKPKKMPRDGNTRWNSTYDMLQFVLDYQGVYDAFTADEDLDLLQYALDQQSWKIVKELCLVLKRFKDATLYFSRDNACVANIIPILDKLDSHLNPITQRRLHPAILAALKLGRNKFNRHYANSDRSPVCRLGLSKCNSNLIDHH